MGDGGGTGKEGRGRVKAGKQNIEPMYLDALHTEAGPIAHLSR